MKTTKISKLSFLPEEYGKKIYEKIDWSVIDSEMTDGQRRFINGLVQYYKPNKVLELGVSAGGGTTVLLNSVESYGGILYSIDSAKQFYRNPDLPVGYCALEKYSDLLNRKWHLFVGQDPADVMDTIDEKFDFCVIDTYHHHPVEILNFIAILPWLNDGAVVVMHDTAAFEWRTKSTFLRMLAPRLLLSVVCAEKYIPDLPSGDMTVSNIAAWQVNDDTRKYCQNLFDILYLPWEVSISKTTYQSMSSLVQKYYSNQLSGYFEEAVSINKSMLLDKHYGLLCFEKKYKQLKKNTVFYGAGVRMKNLLTDLEYFDVEFPFQIWDKNADRIEKIGEYPVKIPDFNTVAETDQVMIVTIEDKVIYKEVYQQFASLGYTIFYGLKEYLDS